MSLPQTVMVVEAPRLSLVAEPPITMVPALTAMVMALPVYPALSACTNTVEADWNAPLLATVIASVVPLLEEICGAEAAAGERSMMVTTPLELTA